MKTIKKSIESFVFNRFPQKDQGNSKMSAGQILVCECLFHLFHLFHLIWGLCLIFIFVPPHKLAIQRPRDKLLLYCSPIFPTLWYQVQTPSISPLLGYHCIAFNGLQVLLPEMHTTLGKLRKPWEGHKLIKKRLKKIISHNGYIFKLFLKSDVSNVRSNSPSKMMQGCKNCISKISLQSDIKFKYVCTA